MGIVVPIGRVGFREKSYHIGGEQGKASERSIYAAFSTRARRSPARKKHFRYIKDVSFVPLKAGLSSRPLV